MNELSQFLTSHGASILFLAILAEQLGLPLPAAPVLVTTGALAANGGVSPALAISITVLACVPGDLIWYYAGRRRGNRVMQFIRRIFLCDSLSMGRSERLFAKYGIAAIAGAKFIPGVSFVIPALAGAFKITFGRFIWLDLVGSVFYGLFYILLGVVFSTEISGAIKSLSEVGFWVSVVTFAATGAFVVYRHVQLRKAARAQSKGGSSALITVSEA